MTRWPADNQSALLAFYGTPGPQVERQLVPVVPPFKMYYDGKPVRQIMFHKKAAPALQAALNEIWDKCGKDQGKLDKLGVSKYAGAYNPRKIRGSTTKWSNHAYGAALDINAEQNGFNTGHGNMPDFVINAFKRQGARWGGDYHGRTDPMHFEFCDNGGAKPVGFTSDVQADNDNDNDAPDNNDAPAEPTAENDNEKPSLFKRIRNHVLGWGGSAGGLGFLGYLTDWQVVAILCGFLFVTVAAVTAFVILFFGADKVRAWVGKQTG